MMPVADVRRPPNIGRRVSDLAVSSCAEAGFRGDGRPRSASLSMSWAWDTILALGLLLSPASQLRLRGLPIGPGELCLLVSLLLMLGREVARLGPPLTPALSRLLIFWALFTIALSIGTVTAFVIQDSHDSTWFLHDIVAYPFLAAVSCLSVVEPGAGPRLRRVAWLLVVLGTGSLALQLAEASGLVDIVSSDPWFWDRFRGWSANPAQLALLCAALGLLSLHLVETADRHGKRLAAIACAILPIYVGRLSKTDTFMFVLVAAAPMFVALKFRTWLLSPDHHITFRAASGWMFILALPLMFAAAAPLGSSIAAQTEALAKLMSKDNGKTTGQEAELRLQIWSEALGRGMEAGMLGLGPGPHLQTPPSLLLTRMATLDRPKGVLHPDANGTPNFEAHNTTLDLFLQGGLLAVLSFFWLVAMALSSTYKARLAGLTTLLCGLLLFSMFVLIARHPIFWFAIGLCLVADAGTARTAVVRDSG
jgi:O-antigen ligase